MVIDATKEFLKAAAKVGVFPASAKLDKDDLELQDSIQNAEGRISTLEGKHPIKAADVAAGLPSSGELVSATISFKGDGVLTTTVTHTLKRKPVGVIAMAKHVTYPRTHVWPDRDSYTATDFDVVARRGDSTSATVRTQTVDFWVF